MRRDAQELLARIRTDLDCFCDIEFRALLVDVHFGVTDARTGVVRGGFGSTGSGKAAAS